MAAQGIKANPALPARGWNPLLRRTGPRLRQISRIRLRSSEPRALSRAPISPTYPGPGWRFWEVADQRFVDHRPDVLSFVSQPLEHDLIITGELSAQLFASTTGTDADFVVKLIDVYPESGTESMNGYQLPIAMEIRRGRYLHSYEHPEPLPANQPQAWQIPLRDHDYAFLKGHRLMVQIQSTWFPVIDRNPQTFVPSIYLAKPADFISATQRIYTTPEMPSSLLLPIIQ